MKTNLLNIDRIASDIVQNFEKTLCMERSLKVTSATKRYIVKVCYLQKQPPEVFITTLLKRNFSTCVFM